MKTTQILRVKFDEVPHARDKRIIAPSLLGREQNISAAMTLADRVYIIRNGHIVETLTAQAVRERPEVLHRHLGV